MLSKKNQNKAKRRKFQIIGVLSILFLLTIWFILTENNIIKPLYFPSPSEVVSAFIGIGFRLVEHIIATFIRIIIGFSIGVFIGVTVGLLMSYNDYIYASLHNIIESWRPIPPVALIPFFHHD